MYEKPNIFKQKYKAAYKVYTMRMISHLLLGSQARDLTRRETSKTLPYFIAFKTFEVI